MGIKETDITSLKRKVERYKEVLNNTVNYRKLWHDGFKQEIIDTLTGYSQAAGLACKIDVRDDLRNLEAVVLSLGSEDSGLGEPVSDNLHRSLIKQNGSLVYQQLFNGKVLVLINYPFIEKYGQPAPPKTIAIYRPEELKEAFFMRHLETFVTEISHWEDHDDDMPDANQRIGFKFNFDENTPVAS